MVDQSRKIAETILATVDVKINGNRPWDIQVHHDSFFQRVLTSGSLGFGEAYMDGWWDCEAIDELVTRVLPVKIAGLQNILGVLKSVLFNHNSKSKAFQIGKRHYDLGNDLFEAMLDQRMIYSCGYWKEAQSLDSAQEAKLDLICKKLGLQAGQKVLDIGCGWGGFAQFAAEKYDVRVVGITVSKEQVQWVQQMSGGFPIEVRLQDYRDLRENFDHIVSIGMFEHVGYKNYRLFMEVVRRNLKQDGLFLLHTIGGNISLKSTDPWIHKYIFPNSMLPSMKQITAATERKFIIEDWHNFGLDYDKTLMAWYHNFEKNWPSLKEHYDQRFYRMWKFYLLACAGTFRSRTNQLWQIVMSKNGVPWRYNSVR